MRIHHDLGALAHGGAGDAEEDREHHDLQDFVVHHRADRGVGEDVLDEAIQRHRMRIDAGADAGDRLVDADTGFEQVDQDQPERQRHQRGADEPQHRLAADPADRAGVRHVADADDQCGKHQRADDHLDQAQEDHAAERDVAGEQFLRGGIGELAVDPAPTAMPSSMATRM